MRATNEFDPLNERQPKAADGTELTDEAAAQAANGEPAALSSDDFRSVTDLLAEAIRANMAQGGDRPRCEAIERDPDGFIRELTASRERAIAASWRLRANAAATEAAESTQGWLQVLSAAARNFTTIPRLACASVLLALCCTLVVLPGLSNRQHPGVGLYASIPDANAEETAEPGFKAAEQPQNKNPTDAGAAFVETFDAIPDANAEETPGSGSEAPGQPGAAGQPQNKNPTDAGAALADSALQELENNNVNNAIALASLAIAWIDDGRVGGNESPIPPDIPVAFGHLRGLVERGETQQAAAWLRAVLLLARG